MSAGYDALRSGAAWMDVSARGRISAAGRDRARLLHNITSNDVKKLAPGQGCYAFLLSPQGRIQADAALLCFEDHFLIDTEPELREKVLAHIRKYIIADQVELKDVTGELCALAVEGPGAAAVLAGMGVPALPGADFAHVPWNGMVVAQVTITGQPGYRIYAPCGRTAELIDKLNAAGAVPATPEEARIVRIEEGRPRYGEDIFDTTLPQETQQMHAISFNKGCYLGQEIVERIRARGHVNRKLMRLEIDAAPPTAPGTKLTAQGADAGEITSAVLSPLFGKVVALAYVRVPHDAPGTALDAGGDRAVVR